MTADSPIAVVATFAPRSGKESELEAVLREVAAGTRGEPGCRFYSVWRSARDDGTQTFHILESYADNAALEAHRASEHYKTYRAAVADLLNEPIGVLVLDSVDDDPR